MPLSNFLGSGLKGLPAQPTRRSRDTKGNKPVKFKRPNKSAKSKCASNKQNIVNNPQIRTHLNSLKKKDMALSFGYISFTNKHNNEEEPTK